MIDNLLPKEQSYLVVLLRELHTNAELAPAELSPGRVVEFVYPGFTVYNPTIPFESAGELVMAGRVEKRDGHDSRSVFFREQGDAWHPIPDAPVFKLEDPFAMRVRGQLVFGGVSVDQATHAYHTEFYAGRDIYNLEPLMTGPSGMKDIRLLDLPDGSIGVFTRPQGVVGGSGKIGFCKISEYGEFCDELVGETPLIQDHFGQKRWGGVNQALLLADGVTIGIVGHVAEFEWNGDKRYSAMIFEYNAETGESTPMEIIARREDFPPTEPKIPGLANVAFSSGITFAKNDTHAVLWAGLGDAAIGNKAVAWPFSQQSQ